MLLTVAAAFPATINLPPAAAGKKLEILDNRFQPVVSTTATPPSQEVQLKRGLYVAQVLTAGLQTPQFEVNGTEEVNVSF